MAILYQRLDPPTLQAPDYIDNLGVANVWAVLFKGDAQNPDSGTLDRLVIGDELLDQLARQITTHAVIDTPAGQNDIGMIAELLSLMG